MWILLVRLAALGRLIHRFGPGPAAGRGGRKKTAGLAGGFSGISFALRAPSTLSIRQRSEIPVKVKIKLGGHGGDAIHQKS
ncbi:hypothetical protein [Burkholderia guangdongensis]|uniref:hypothetical protein n=1 Tax=Burkholderia guangdongensis TaxID=1792500 RepID=UPI0015CAD0C6|nr:hypothetical protein [Burkholderia guangdongensis]